MMITQIISMIYLAMAPMLTIALTAMDGHWEQRMVIKLTQQGMAISQVEEMGESAEIIYPSLDTHKEQSIATPPLLWLKEEVQAQSYRVPGSLELEAQEAIDLNKEEILPFRLLQAELVDISWLAKQGSLLLQSMLHDAEQAVSDADLNIIEAIYFIWHHGSLIKKSFLTTQSQAMDLHRDFLIRFFSLGGGIVVIGLLGYGLYRRWRTKQTLSSGDGSASAIDSGANDMNKTISKQSLGQESLNHMHISYDDYEFAALVGEDIIAAKLNLATAYMNMGNYTEAKALLKDIKQTGNVEQQKEAEALLSAVGM